MARQSNSIGGKVPALADQSGGIIWSSDSAGSYDGGVSIYGISETSTTLTPHPSTLNAPAHHSIRFYATAVEIEPVIGLV